VDLPAVLLELRTLLQPGLEMRNIRIQFEVAAALPKVAGDASQLQQVFLNLFTNAVDAMPGGGTLAVRASAAEGGERVRCDVEDTGDGIADAMLAHIFEPFVTSKAQGEGTGLGLAVARDIVTRHGGTIEVKSHEGHGTCFTLYLPVYQEEHRA